MQENTYRILIIGEFPPPPGGMAQQAEVLSNCLKSEKFLISRCKINIQFPNPLSFLNDLRFIRTLLILPFIYFSMIIKIIFSDIIHIFSSSFLSFFLYTCVPLIFAKIFKKRVIINYHGGAADAFLKKQITWVKPFLKLSDRIVVPSKFLENVFKSYGFGATVVYNIANTERFRFRKRKRIDPNFIVTRHLEPEYGIDVVLKSFQRIHSAFPDAKLSIVGHGTQAKALMRLAQKLGIADKVSFTGRVHNRELPKLYSKADIFINASRIDNFPISIIEAFASGLPVITTRAGGIPYIVEDEVTGLLVDVDDERALADMAKKLLFNPSLATFLISNAKQKVESFSWHNVRRNLLQTYQIQNQR